MHGRTFMQLMLSSVPISFLQRLWFPILFCMLHATWRSASGRDWQSLSCDCRGRQQKVAAGMVFFTPARGEKEL